LVMVFAFLFIVFYLQQAGCVLLVFACQFMMYKELIQIGRRNSKERELGWLVKGGFQLLYWYWFFLTTFIVYGQTLEEHIYFHRDMIPKTFKSIDAIFDLYVLYSFGLYALGLVAFVLMLKKQHYKYQFQRFAHSHCVLLAVVVQSSVLVSNMFQGMIWFLLPCLLVITNDIMAYIFGFTMGKTPLIKLSPKKTWEGFIGGWVSTVFLGFAFSRFLIQFPLMVCPTKGFVPEYWPQCETSELFRLGSIEETFGPVISSRAPEFMKVWQVMPMDEHVFWMSMFAAMVAPFGGFFASGFKRAFKIKDFGDSIPGHGGITDRMDCQIMMGMFVYTYINSRVFKTIVGDVDPEAVVRLFEDLTDDQKIRIYSTLGRALTRRGLLSQ